METFMETLTGELANPTISVNFAELERFDKSPNGEKSICFCIKSKL